MFSSKKVFECLSHLASNNCVFGLDETVAGLIVEMEIYIENLLPVFYLD